MSFAENLKQIRKEKNISQEKLAELLGVSRQAVSKWEQGIGYPEVGVCQINCVSRADYSTHLFFE